MYVRKIIAALLSALLTAVLAYLLQWSGGLQTWEGKAWDMLQRVNTAPSPASSEIRLILLDQASLDWVSEEMQFSWPWPREVYLAIAGFCRESGVRALAFDVLFTEPSVYGVDDDERLGSELKAVDRMVSAVGVRQGLLRNINVDVIPDPFNISGVPPATNSMPVLPIEQVMTNSWALGNVSENPDADSIYRRVLPARMTGELGFMNLGAALYLAGLTKPADIPVEVHRTKTGWLVARQHWPADSQGRLLLRYFGDEELYKPLSAAAVIQSYIRMQSGEPPVISADTLTDKYVIFGFSAPGLKDLRATPVSGSSPGALVHATLLDNLLSNTLFRGVSILAWLIVLAGYGFLCVLGILCCRRVWHHVWAGLLCLGLPVAVIQYMFLQGWQVPVLSTEIAVFSAVCLGGLYNYANEGRQKLFIKKAFKHYLSPAVIEDILTHPDRLQLGGERRCLTIFFSDIEKFSTFSETLAPDQLTALLNDYLSMMTDTIQAEGGTVDKYIGDAVVAFWNAPLTQADHGVRACRAAVTCQQRLKDRRAEYKKQYGVDLHMRIGLHTGEVTVGNMGSRERFDYTVLGDAANLASRLEGANKYFHTSVMLSAATADQPGVKEAFALRSLGSVQVMGRAQPVKVYELAGVSGQVDESYLDRFNTAVEMLQKNPEDSLRQFKQWPDDPVAQLLADKVQQACDRPEGWQGVWKLEGK